MIEVREPRSRHVSSFHVELLRIGESSPSENAWITEHLERCSRCAAMRASFEACRNEFAARVAARSTAREWRPAPTRRRLLWLGALFMPVAAGLVVILSLRHPTVPPATDAAGEPDLAVKGGVRFLVVARRREHVFPVRPGERLRPGDQIRFAFDGVRYPYVLIASVDGAGHASIYAPYDGARSAEVAVGDRVEMPGSIVIDDTPGPERLFALFSRRPLEAGPVRAAAAAIGTGGASAIRRATRLDVGADEELSMLFEKASP